LYEVNPLRGVESYGDERKLWEQFFGGNQKIFLKDVEQYKVESTVKRDEKE